MPITDRLSSGDSISFLDDLVVGSEFTWMPLHEPSVVVVACTSRISYRQPRAEWTFDVSPEPDYPLVVAKGRPISERSDFPGSIAPTALVRNTSS